MDNEYKPVKSSLVSAYSYNPDSYTLDVMFKDGTEMQYQNVMPPEMSHIFDSSGSIGSKLLKVLKGHKHSRI